jgi:DNA-binding transcriptional ArsR family regulator
MGRPFQHPSGSDITLDAVLHALSDPVRRNILFKLLGCDGLSCSKACEELPPSTISFHYRVLREAGLIRSEKKGVEVINSARKDEIEARFPGLLASVFQHHHVHSGRAGRSGRAGASPAPFADQKGRSRRNFK